MDRKYWDNIFENYNTEIFDVLKNDKNEIIKSYINNISSSKKTVADFGCGIGKWLPTLSKQFMEVFAIDFSSSNMEYCEKKYKHVKNINYLTIDMAHDWKSRHHFDVVLCVNAILNESLSKRTIFFNNISANLSTNGHLVLVVPSLESSLFSRFVLEKCNRKKGLNTKSSQNEHVKFNQGVVNIDKVPTKHYLKEELISTLNDVGFNIIKIDKAEYSWNTEIENPPKSLKAPYPWDWVVMATKK